MYVESIVLRRFPQLGDQTQPLILLTLPRALVAFQRSLAYSINTHSSRLDHSIFIHHYLIDVSVSACMNE